MKKDRIVEKIREELLDRSVVGQRKYGKTLCDEIDDGTTTVEKNLQELKEELLDAVLYLQTALEQMNK